MNFIEIKRIHETYFEINLLKRHFCVFGHGAMPVHSHIARQNAKSSKKASKDGNLCSSKRRLNILRKTRFCSSEKRNRAGNSNSSPSGDHSSVQITDAISNPNGPTKESSRSIIPLW